MFLILSGKVRIVGRDGLGHERVLHTYTQRGEFTSDVTQLSNKPAVVEPVLLVGGGNSAGQAAVFLAAHAEHVHLFIRGTSLEHSMSRYLTERIAVLPNVTVHTRVDLRALEGGARLERVYYRGAGGVEGCMTTHHLFVFIGAAPNTAWLATCGVQRDEKGFVLTGAEVPDAAPHVPSLQTSLEGVFAIGDVRSGSIKRVASAVGEGAAVVAQIHAVLAGMRGTCQPGTR